MHMLAACLRVEQEKSILLSELEREFLSTECPTTAGANTLTATGASHVSIGITCSFKNWHPENTMNQFQVLSPRWAARATTRQAATQENKLLAVIGIKRTFDKLGNEWW